MLALFSSKNNVLSVPKVRKISLSWESFPSMKTSGFADIFEFCLWKLEWKWESILQILPLACNHHLRPGDLPESVSSQQCRLRPATCEVVPKKSASRNSTMHSVCSSKVRGLILDVCVEFCFSTKQAVFSSAGSPLPLCLLKFPMGHRVLEPGPPLCFRNSCSD